MSPVWHPFVRLAGTEPSLALRTGVIIQSVLLVVAAGTLLQVPPAVALPALGIIVLQAVLLIAIWNLRRWALVTYAGLALLGVLQLVAWGAASAGTVIGFLLFRALVLFPGAICWRDLDGGRRVGAAESEASPPVLGSAEERRTE